MIGTRRISLTRKLSSASKASMERLPVMPFDIKSLSEMPETDETDQEYTQGLHPDRKYANGNGFRDPATDMIGAEIQETAANSGVVPDDSFTVSQAVNTLGFGKFQIILSFVTGLCWMADSMEIMILSILSPALHCEWGASQYKQAILTTVVFAGMMLSSAFWGKVSDKFGRRKALLISSFYLFFYGFMSAFAKNYSWILFLRFLVGFNIGCVPQSVTLFSEFLPTKQRGKCVVLLDVVTLFRRSQFSG